MSPSCIYVFFFFQAEDGIRDVAVTGVQTCALPIFDRCGCRRNRSRRNRDLDRLLLVLLLLFLGGGELLLFSGFVGGFLRSEERRVGKECRSRCLRYR